MEKEKKDKMLKMVSETIEKMENKDFFVYFYVVCVTFIFDVYIQEYVLFLKSYF